MAEQKGPSPMDRGDSNTTLNEPQDFEKKLDGLGKEAEIEVHDDAVGARELAQRRRRRRLLWGTGLALLVGIAVGLGVGLGMSNKSASGANNSVSSGSPSSPTPAAEPPGSSGTPSTWEEQDRALLNPTVTQLAASKMTLFPCPASRANSAYEPRKGDPDWVTRGLVQRPNCKAQMIISGNDYGMDTSKSDNWFEFSLAIAACRKASVPCRLVLEKGGAYRMSQERAINMENLTDFSLDLQPPAGQGRVTLSFVRMHRISHLMNVVNCTRCEFRGFDVDWQWDRWPLASVVKMAAVRDDSRELDLEFFQFAKPGGSPKSRRQQQAAVFDASKIAGYRSLHLVDPVRYNMAVRGATEHFSINSNLESVTPVPNSNVITLKFKEALRPPIQAGSIHLIRHFVYTGHAFTVAACVHCTFDDLNIWSAPGKAGTFKDDCEYLSFTRMKITRPDEPYSLTGRPRPMSVTADGLFFEKTRGKIIIADVEIGWNGDDCLNNHDTIWGNWNFQRTGGNSILIPAKVEPGPDLIGGSADGGSGGTVSVPLPKDSRWPPVTTDPDFMVGDKVQLRRQSLETFVSTSVTAASKSEAGWSLTFADRIPDNVNVSTLVLVNERRNGGKFLVRNLTCQDNRARGILLQVGDSMVVNSRFGRSAQSGLMIHADPGVNEGVGVVNSAITNNTFDGCEVDLLFGQGCIFVAAGSGSAQNIHSQINISGNRLKNMPGWSFKLANLADSVIEGNIVENPDPANPEKDERAKILVENSRNVKISGNTWLKSPYVAAFSSNGATPSQAQLVLQGSGNQGIQVASNKVI